MLLQERMAPKDEKTLEITASTVSSSADEASLPDEAAHSFYYLSPEACYELPRFQYKGEDRSLLYAHVLSPLAQFCVDRFVPRWMAPNSITLIGLFFMISSYSVMWYFSPDLIPQPDAPPRWVYLLNAACILLYQTLDNIDGKQARRTHTSSPLGLLFDHGCDAVNSLFGSVNWMICMGLHPTQDVLLCCMMLFGPYALFYIGTWEEYYTGQLIMPPFNGPSEGLLGAALMSLTSFCKGVSFWQERSGWDAFLRPVLSTVLPETILPKDGLRNADLLVVASSFGILQEMLLKVAFVAQKYGRQTIVTLLPFATLLSCFVIVGRTNLDIWMDSPRTSLHLCATLFAEMVTELMLKHTTQQAYQSLRWILSPLILLTAAVATGYLPAGDRAQDVLLVYSTAAFIYLAMKTSLVIHEICTLLNIWCFDIVTPRPTRSTPVSVSTHRTSTNGGVKAE